MGPRTQAADHLHATKYRHKGEDFREAANRVAYALQDDDKHYHPLRELLLDMRFLPGGRIQTAMGSTRHATPYNCYVSGTIADSLVEGNGCIMDRLKEAVTTLRLGGGIGYDFSTLRPEGDRVAKLDTVSSGPVSYLGLFNMGGDTTAGVGFRMGAQMGILRVDHPDIEAFVHAKQSDGKLKRFNLSVAVTDEFMEAVAGNKPFMLRWGARDYREVDAAALWEKVMRSTWDWAEPGVFFVDRVNRANNLYYCETIAATNPCGEQPLPPFGACLLGSWNLVKYLRRGALSVVDMEPPDGGSRGWYFDWDQLDADIPHVVRAMDNVVDRARYPLAEQKAEALNKRRMGLGVCGLANAGEAMGHPYGSHGFLEFEAKVLERIRTGAYLASAALAKEKGPFTLYDAERYCKGEHFKTLPEEVQEAVRRDGIRNSHLTSIAPTGTIALTADNVSSGIEPVIFHEVDRPIEMPEGRVVTKVHDYGAEFLGVRGKLAHEVTAAEHVAVQVTAQKYVDSAVSKTCNVSGSMPWADFKGIYSAVYAGGGKGCTTFNPDGKRKALLEQGKPTEQTSADGAACYVDENTGRRECA